MCPPSVDLGHNISTHALREEGDSTPGKCGTGRKQISTHALREEGDLSASALLSRGINFYPRPP